MITGFRINNEQKRNKCVNYHHTGGCYRRQYENNFSYLMELKSADLQAILSNYHREHAHKKIIKTYYRSVHNFGMLKIAVFYKKFEHIQYQHRTAQKHDHVKGLLFKKSRFAFLLKI
jgi:hypothetical protein